MEVQFLGHMQILVDCLKQHQFYTRLPQSEKNEEY